MYVTSRDRFLSEIIVVGRRNGRQPNVKMQEVLKKTIEDARAMTSKVRGISFSL